MPARESDNLTKRAAEIVTVEHGPGSGYCAIAINGERVTGHGSQGHVEDQARHDRALLVAAWRGPGLVEERQHAGEAEFTDEEIDEIARSLDDKMGTKRKPVSDNDRKAVRAILATTGYDHGEDLEWADAIRAKARVIRARKSPAAPPVPPQPETRPMLDEVKDCDECPYSYRGPMLAGGWRCVHPVICPPDRDSRGRKIPMTDDGPSGPPPDWCPLRTSATLVRLRAALPAVPAPPLDPDHGPAPVAPSCACLDTNADDGRGAASLSLSQPHDGERATCSPAEQGFRSVLTVIAAPSPVGEAVDHTAVLSLVERMARAALHQFPARFDAPPPTPRQPPPCDKPHFHGLGDRCDAPSVPPSHRHLLDLDAAHGRTREAFEAAAEHLRLAFCALTAEGAETHAPERADMAELLAEINEWMPEVVERRVRATVQSIAAEADRLRAEREAIEELVTGHFAEGSTIADAVKAALDDVRADLKTCSEQFTEADGERVRLRQLLTDAERRLTVAVQDCGIVAGQRDKAEADLARRDAQHERCAADQLASTRLAYDEAIQIANREAAPDTADRIRDAIRKRRDEVCRAPAPAAPETRRKPCLLCNDTGITLPGLDNIDLDAGLPCPQLSQHALARAVEEPAPAPAVSKVLPNVTATCAPTCAAWTGEACNCKAPAPTDGTGTGEVVTLTEWTEIAGDWYRHAPDPTNDDGRRIVGHVYSVDAHRTIWRWRVTLGEAKYTAIEDEIDAMYAIHAANECIRKHGAAHGIALPTTPAPTSKET